MNITEYYEHYGVYIGQNQVIHFAGEPGDSELLDDSAMVRKVSLSVFKQDSEYRIIAFPRESSISGYHLYSAEETVERAKSRLGEKGYGPLEIIANTLLIGAKQE